MYPDSYLPPYHPQPMVPWYPTEVFPVDALEDHPLPRHQAAFTAAQLDPSPSMNLYPSLPTSVERTLEYRSFAQDPSSFPSTDGLSTADSPDIERVNSQSEAEAVASALEDADDDPLPDQPLPADAARWISLSPAQFDRQFPGGNPFVIEELNMYAEEDLESASYVELDARALNRISIIFWTVEQALFPQLSIRDLHRNIIWGVLADLFEDGKIWLWVDCDEEKCADLEWSGEEWVDKLKRSLEYVKRRLACSSLSLRTPRIRAWSCFQERVSKASFATRVSVVTWAVFTAVSVREAGCVRGLTDWTRCGVLHAVWRWQSAVQNLMSVHIIEDKGRNSQFEVAFKATLRSQGHSCYPAIRNDWKKSLECWLHLQSFLRSTPSSNDVSLTLSVPWRPTSCQQCDKLMKLYAACNNVDYVEPSLSLVFLNHWRVDFDLDMTAWLIILALGVSSGIISDAVLTRMDEMMPMYLDIDGFSLRYQPWVNRIPTKSLEASAVTCSESDWREAEHALRRENRHSLIPASPWDSAGLGVRITALYLLMAEHSSQKLTPHKLLSAYYDMDENEVFDGSAYYPAHIAALVEAFCAATSRASNASVHTCCEFDWEALAIGFQKCYAAAYLLLHPKSRYVPLLEPLLRPVLHAHSCRHCYEDCVRTCVRCQELPVLPTSNEDTHPPAVPTVVVAPPAPAVSQISLESGSSRASTLSKNDILPKLKDHFAKLLGALRETDVQPVLSEFLTTAQYNIPLQYTNLGAPQLPWCTLPQLLKSRHLEITGWPKDLPLPDATGKHNAKGIMGLSAKDARRLYEALDGISFRKAGSRPREEDNIELRPTKKVRGMGKALVQEGEKKFRLSEVQTVIRGIRVEKFD